MISTTQAARILGVTPRRVRALIQAKRLPAERIGRDWVIDEADLKAVKARKPGKPRKERTMKRFIIENEISGHVFGTYEAATKEEALDALAKEAGYIDWHEACSVSSEKGIVVTEA